MINTEMTKTSLRLSYDQERYVAALEGPRRILNWSGKTEMWDYDDCVFSIVGMGDGLARIIVRRKKSFDSTYVEKTTQINLMIGFKVKEMQEPIEEKYSEPPAHNVPDKKYGQKRTRWAIHFEPVLDNVDPAERPISNCCIWQWAESGEDKTIKNSKLYELYTEILEKRGNPPVPKNIFDVQTEKQTPHIIPVLYQPRVDAWNNFIREIHTHKIDERHLEVTIIFNDEQLRKHFLLDVIYRIFRRFKYRRIKDVESFKIMLEKIPENYTFELIYSGKYALYDDSIHEDKPDSDGNVPLHKIKYYFSSTNHPVVFVNTSNHAFAEHDNNHFHWKWEYVAWGETSSIIFGTKSRSNIDNEFRRVKNY
jgi:hypothetical protein